MPAWSIGRTTQVYVKPESGGYAVSPTFAATDAVRHLNGLIHFNPFSPAKSPARFQDPGYGAPRSRRQAATMALKHEWYPSGVLNTLAESDQMLANGFGQVAQNITLAATVLTAASSPAEAAPTTSQFAITDATNLVAGTSMVAINLSTGANAGIHVAMVTVIAAAAGTAPKKLITIDPPLPTAPVLGDTVKAGITYSATTAPLFSLDVGMYPQVVVPKNMELLGWAPNKLSWMFDSGTEPILEVSGPAQGWAGAAPTWAAQAQPGGFTTVGLESGLTSGMNAMFRMATGIYQFTKFQLDMDNGFALQNNASGTNKATALYRKGKRLVSGKCSAMVSTDLSMYTPSITGPGTTYAGVLQQGNVSGKIWAIYAKAMAFMDIPDTPDSDEERQWAFNIECKRVLGNDEIFVFQG